MAIIKLTDTLNKKLLEGILEHDLKILGFKTNFILDLRNYSKTYFGLYDPNQRKVILYIYKDKGLTTIYPYRDILFQAIHECVHHTQWEDPLYIRYKGVMHNSQFYSLLSDYQDRADRLLSYREMKNNEGAFNIKNSLCNNWNNSKTAIMV